MDNKTNMVNRGKNIYKHYKAKFLDYYLKCSVQTKSTIWFTFCNTLQKGINILIIPILTRLLTTEDYGTYTLFIAWLEIITIFTSLRLSQDGYNVGLVKYENERDRYTSSMLGLSIVITVSVFCIYLLGFNFWNNLFNIPVQYVFMLFLYCLVTPAYDFWAAKQRFEYHYVRLTFLTIAMSFISPIVSTVILYLGNRNIEKVIYPKVFFQVLFCIALFIIIMKKSNTFYAKEYWTYALKQNVPLVPYYLSLIVLNHSDRIIIAQLCNKTVSAIYSVAYSAAMLPQVVSSAITVSTLPWLFTCLKQKQDKCIWPKMRNMMIIVMLTVFSLIIIAPEAINILAPKEYYDAVWIIPPISISAFFIFLYQQFINVEFYYSANRVIVYSSIGVAIMNIILNYLLIPFYGYFAAGYTTLISYGIFMLFHLWKVRKINYGIFQVKSILLMSIVSVISGLACMFLYNYVFVKYSLLAIIISLIIFIKYKDKLLKINFNKII